MSKILELKIKECGCEYLDVPDRFKIVPDHFKTFSIPRKPKIEFSEIDNIVKERGGVVSEEEFDNAINTLIIYFAQERLNNMMVDIEFKNRNTPKKMTMKEIEAALGHKVKIVKEKNHE